MVVSVLCIFLTIQLVSLQCSQSITVFCVSSSRYSWLVSVFAVNHSNTVMWLLVFCVSSSRYSWLVCSVRSQSQLRCHVVVSVLCIFLTYSWLVCSVRSQSQLHCHVVVSVLCIFLTIQLVSLQCSQSITVTLSCGC